MEDHHVDRPGVEVWQHMKLTGTNHSIGLIRPRSGKPDNTHIISAPQIRSAFFDDLVVMAKGSTPDPIPNSAVKTLRANGTVSQGTGE